MKQLIYNIFLVGLLAYTNQATAKKVKFAVDMRNDSVSVNGVHVSGDFQEIAGYAGGDWNSATTLLTKEGSTDIYSIVLDLPAYRKYEYKFVNGEQFYEVEFVPEPSRVGYSFNDNRWLYVDSLADDTTFVGAILFSGNAPAGLKLARFKVDLRGKSVSSDGVHLTADFNNWNQQNIYMYSFENKTSEVIQYVSAGSYQYKYINGEVTAEMETVPSACAQNSNRYIDIQRDTVLDIVCFNECTACINAGVDKAHSANTFVAFPNPSQGNTTLFFEQGFSQLMVTDLSGRLINKQVLYSNQKNIELSNLSAGVYIAQITSEYSTQQIKFIIQ
jgi:hypothetical protein